MCTECRIKSVVVEVCRAVPTFASGDQQQTEVDPIGHAVVIEIGRAVRQPAVDADFLHAVPTIVGERASDLVRRVAAHDVLHEGRGGLGPAVQATASRPRHVLQKMTSREDRSAGTRKIGRKVDIAGETSCEFRRARPEETRSYFPGCILLL